ncbi:hypothetical protein M011DRAFT_21334 [Sporormia fimetaria CBS 119925]|uniref:Uncharacterized protein n=1 Tax=Sporormia fimetaria CBS 119925 TaxID=1340428 RepID=A0A6A6VQY2_9PLEO|nr:hypothetical protein M011DRAFT_21334 [Sporormia fimetaria CBS 119925]
MSTESSKAPSTGSTIFTFLALYLTTLFSLDTWGAAQSSPYRAPGTHVRPLQRTPRRDSYQGRMTSLRSNGSRDVGRVPSVQDSRPPMRMGGTASCGACAL